MSRRSGVIDVARTVTTAVRRVEDLRRGRLPVIDGRADASNSVFLRGVALGALVGAAIAGSTIWERRRKRSMDERIRPELLEDE